MSSTSYLILSWNNPYSLNWDLYEHQTLIRVLLQGKLNFFTSELSDSFGFNAYPPTFHLIIALGQKLIGTLNPEKILIFWQITEMWQAWLSCLAIAFFGWSVTKNKWIVILMMIMSSFFFDSVLAFSTYFFLPQTLVAVLGGMVLARLFYKEGKISVFELIVTAFGLILHHYLIGTLVSLIYIFVWLGWKYTETKKARLRELPLAQIIIIAYATFLWLSYKFNFESINRGEAKQYIFDLHQRWQYFTRSHGFFPFIFIPLGIIDLWHKCSKKILFSILISLGFITLFLSNLPYIFKSLVVGRYFFILMIAIGINAFLKHLHIIYKLSTIFLLSCMLMIGLILNTYEWKRWLISESGYNHISTDDLKASDFLINNYSNKSAILVGDPTTQYYLEGLSGINSPGGFSGDRLALDLIFWENSPVKKARIITNQKDKIDSSANIFIYAYSGRSRLWHNSDKKDKERFDYNIWQSHQLSISDIILVNRLSNSDSFIKVYENKSIVLFEVK